MATKAIVKDNTSKIMRETEVKLNIFQRFMTDEIVNISRPKTPKKRGRLRDEVIKQVIGTRATITWGVNYAARMERVRYANYTTPGTGPHFAENAVEKAKDSIEKIARKARLI